MKKLLLIPTLLFLFLLQTTNPRQISADGSCTDPSFPRFECALSNPGGCQPHGVCTGGLLDHFCCPAFAPPPPGGGGGGGQALCADGVSIDTAIGCIRVDSPFSFIEFVLPWAIGIAGGIAFLLIIYAGFLIMTSSGDPHKMQAGKELLTAALMGLILLVFSVFVLRVIGVDILKIF